MESLVNMFKTLTYDNPHPQMAIENSDDQQFRQEVAGFENDMSVESEEMDAAVVGRRHITPIRNRSSPSSSTSVVQLLKKKNVDFQEILRLIREGQNVNAKDKFQNSVLHLAIHKINNDDRNHIAFIENLLTAGADVQARDTGGNTPFMLAAEKNKFRVLQILASHHMNEINAQNSKRETALHLAVGKKQRESVSMLHRFAATHGFKENIKAKSTGMTALQLAKSGPPIDQGIVAILESDPSQRGRISLKAGDLLTGIQTCIRKHLEKFLQNNSGNFKQFLYWLRFMKVTKDERYKMDAVPRGKCLIIQNEDFESREESSSDESSRSGCKDADLIEEAFVRLNFVIERVPINRKALEMCEDLIKFSKQDHKRYDCIVVCISSHGCQGGIFGTDWKMVPIQYILDTFSKNELEEKPKLFFFNACRSLARPRKVEPRQNRARLDGCISGDQLDDLLFLEEGNGASDSPQDYKRAKAMRHIFIGYSSPEGQASFRMVNSSSFYFKHLCETLNEYGDSKEFQRIMTIVNQRVWNASLQQVPSPVNMLFKELWFAPQRS